MKKLFKYILPVFFVGISAFFTAHAQVVNPQWRINTPSSTITPINSSLQVPCANIVGGCGGGGGGFVVPSSSLSAAVRFPFTYELAAGANCGAQTGVTDAVVCMQDIYANLPSVGGSVWVPFGSYDATGSVMFGTNGKLMLVMGAVSGGFYDGAGTTWNFHPSSSGRFAFTYDTNNFVTGNSGMLNFSIVGPAGSGNIGSSTVTSSYGIRAGMTSNGAFSLTLNGVNLSSLGTGLLVATNTSFLNIVNSNIAKNGQAISEPQTNGANGENMRVSNSVISDCNSLVGSSIADDCVLIQQSGNVQWHFILTSFDDAQVHSTQFGGTANLFDFTDDHCEDPNTSIGGYDCILTQSSAAGAAATVISVTGGDFMQDKTSSPPAEFISYGGTLILTGVTCDINNNLTNPMAALATPLNSQATISWHGMANQGYNSNNNLNTGCTNMYGSNAYSVDGLGFGSNAPSYSFSTSTSQFNSKVQILSNDLEDASGNRFATLINASTGYVAVVNSSQSLADSNIYQPLSGVSTLTVVQATSTLFTGATSTTLTPITIGGHLLVMFESGAPTTTLPKDNMGQTWALAATSSQGTGVASLYYMANSLAISSATCNIAATSASAEVCNFYEISGAATSSVFDVAAGWAGNNAVNPATSTLYTTTNANDIILFGLRTGAASADYTAGSGFTLPANSTTTRSAMQYSVVSSIQTNAFTSMTLASAQTTDNIVAAFKAAITSSNNFIGIGTTHPSTTVDIEGASSTLFIQCFKTLDHSTTSIVYNWIYSSSTALIATAVKPTFCQ